MMRKLSKNKRGQFVIIAVLLMAIMIISVAATVHRAATYYKHEPWDEYSTLISNIELSSRRLVELSLANYTKTNDPNILKNNLIRWQNNLTGIYPGYGIALKYTLSNGTKSVSGNLIDFHLGLNCTWGRQRSVSAASANFTLDVTSIGLNGYKFDVLTFVDITVLNVQTVSGGKLHINVTVTDETQVPLVGLNKDNFLPEVTCTSFAVTSEYDHNYILIYTIQCQGVTGSPPVPLRVNAWDSRGVQVKAAYP